MAIRIVIVDDHGIIRTGLTTFISDAGDMTLVGEASTAEGAIEVIRETQPDIVTLDLGLPDRSGLDIISTIRQVSPETRILVFSGQDEPGIVREAMVAGSTGYVVKAASFGEVGTAIRNLCEGRSLILLTQTPESQQTLLGLRQDDGHPRTSTAGTLSEREQEVLQLIAQGHTNQSIADSLFLSVKTIETYRSRLTKKLNLKTRADLVRFALDSGMMLSET